MNLLCDAMNINRSSFYYWKKMLSNPAPRTRALIDNIQLFQKYHMKYPSHGYRWLNAKIRLDKGIVMSDPYAHKCCKKPESKARQSIIDTRNRVFHLRYFQIFLCQKCRSMVRSSVLLAI